MLRIKQFFKQLFCSHKNGGLLVIEGRLFGVNAKYNNVCLDCNKLFGSPFKNGISIVKNSSNPASFSFTEIQDPNKW